MSYRQPLLVMVLWAPLVGAFVDETSVLLVDSNGGPLDRFGSSVAVSGDVIVVGSPGDTIGGLSTVGSVTAFRENAGAWVEVQEIIDASGAAFDGFGTAVALSGDQQLLVVGAAGDDIGAQGDAGSATVFRWNGTLWEQEQKLSSSTVGSGDRLGTAVSVNHDGSVIVVGAPGHDLGGKASVGMATVFRWDGAAWSEEQPLHLLHPESQARFGDSVAVSDSGQVIVVGASLDDVAGQVDVGSATVFRWDGTSWIPEQTLVASTSSAGDQFGDAVALTENVIVVGVSRVASSQGAVSVFRRNGTVWSEEALLVASLGAVGDLLGTSVSISGNLIIAGAPGDDVGGAGEQGSSTVFGWNGTSWVEERYLTPSSGQNDLNGSAVAIRGGRAVSGSPQMDLNSNSQQGAAFVHGLWSWVDKGSALAGVSGDPLLQGSGLLSAGSLNSVDLSAAAPGALAVLFVAGSSLPAPFMGGTLLPFPYLGVPLFTTTDGLGSVVISFNMPAGIPAGSTVWAQWAILDASALQGVALSNAVVGTTP